MKLVLATTANGRFFHLLDDLKDEGVTVVEAFDDETLRAEIADAEAIYGWPAAAALAHARRLRWIQTSSAGVEQLWSSQELRERDIIITNTRGAHAPNIAEHAFALLLAFSRGVLFAREAQAARRWEAAAVREVSWELAGGTLGIIGYGRIGRAVGARARGFEMEVVAVDREPVAPDDALAQVWPLDQLDDLLTAADVVVVTAPYTPQACGMLSAAQFATMKPDAGLIVVSRGGLVDHDALVAALQNDQCKARPTPGWMRRQSSRCPPTARSGACPTVSSRRIPPGIPSARSAARWRFCARMPAGSPKASRSSTSWTRRRAISCQPPRPVIPAQAGIHVPPPPQGTIGELTPLRIGHYHRCKLTADS